MARGCVDSPVFMHSAQATMKPQNRKTKAKDSVGRTAPDIPAGIRQVTLADDIFAEPEISFQECLIENVSFKDRSLQSVAIEGCILKGVSFAQCNLRGLRLKNVRLVECDFANTEAIGLKAVRTEFINCRLTGLRAVESECQDFLISGGDAGFTQFRLGTFNKSEFNWVQFWRGRFPRLRSARSRAASL